MTKFGYVLFGLFIGILGYSITEPLYTPTALPVSKDQFSFPMVVAHKALSSDEYIGNTFSAVQDSLSKTVDGIEVDVRLSKDGVLFLYHGDTLEEYTDHIGIPEEFDWEYLKEITYKNSTEKLVKLDDLFKLVGNQKNIFIDIKSPYIFDNTIAYRIVDCIHKHGLTDSVFVESFNPVTLSAIRLYSRDIILVYNFTDNDIAQEEESQQQFDRIPWLLKQHWVQKQIRRIVRPDILAPRFNLNRKKMQELISFGYPVISWTVDDIKIAKQLYSMGVKGIQSNTPIVIEQNTKQENKTILDAGGSMAKVDTMIKVKQLSDIKNALKIAKANGKQITIGGQRHSMGGQTLYDDSLFLDMLAFNQVSYNQSSKTVTVQAGATWKKVQHKLAEFGRSVKVMQSDNIFTVGGSIAVNVHGWQVNTMPIGSTIVKMKVMTADGKIQTISPSINAELFHAVIGGYGMFAIIIEAELETVSNSLVQFNASFDSLENVKENFDKNILDNPKAELGYARFSMNKDKIFDEAGIFWYETVDTNPQVAKIEPEKLIALKRSIFRLSEYTNLGKKIRWQSEKIYSKALAKKEILLNRNDAMNTDIHILWPLYGDNKDILHEYFIPKEELYNFLLKLKDNVQKYNVNILNVTLRAVKQDNTSLLPYAKQDMYALVCLFSQSQKDEDVMQQFTKDVINNATNLGGTFYLPYRLHYDATHLLKAYPELEHWIKVKQKYDPDYLFNSQFFNNIVTLLKK